MGEDGARRVPMTEKYTPWYDPKVDGQPVRVGEYQRRLSSAYLYKTYWDGKLWWVDGENEDGPFRVLSGAQELPWRGLTSPSEGYHV